MTTIEEELDKFESGDSFVYNFTNTLDVTFDEQLIFIDRIKTDGYEIGVNHRPVRTPHVNKIKSTFIGDSIAVKVVFDSRDEFYHIIQGQHLFTAYMQMQSEQVDSIKCEVIKCKSSDIQLDACLPDDRRVCYQYSFRVTDGQERNQLADKISMVVELSDTFKETTGKTQGVNEYIYDNQYGYRKLSIGSIKQYLMFGTALKTHNQLITAQSEQWNTDKIKSVVEGYRMVKKKYTTITFRVESQIAMKFHENKKAYTKIMVQSMLNREDLK
jgi:hypothetical protein